MTPPHKPRDFLLQPAAAQSESRLWQGGLTWLQTKVDLDGRGATLASFLTLITQLISAIHRDTVLVRPQDLSETCGRHGRWELGVWLLSTITSSQR